MKISMLWILKKNFIAIFVSLIYILKYTWHNACELKIMNEKNPIGQGTPFIGRDGKQYYLAEDLDSGYHHISR